MTTNEKASFMTKMKKVQLNEIRQHVWSFILASSLTVFAFIAVGGQLIQHSLSLILFLVMLAIIQIVFHMFVFMHLKDRGHVFPIMFILAAFFITIMVIGGINLWLWW